jgi:large subunit ribosomal protein L7/L12
MSGKINEQLIEQIGSMSVLELSELVKQLEAKFGVSAAMPVAAAATPVPATQAGAKPAEEKSEFKVELVAGGPKVIDTIKALRKVTTLGLSEAKSAVENAPTVIAESASKEEANKMKEALESAGAKVKLS